MCEPLLIFVYKAGCLDEAVSKMAGTTPDFHIIHQPLVQYLSRSTPSIDNYNTLLRYARTHNAGCAELRVVLQQQNWRTWWAGLSTQLVHAARNDRLTVVEELLDIRVRPGNSAQEIYQLLVYICSYNFVEMVKLIVEKGHVLDDMSPEQKNRLVIIGARSDFIELVDFLVQTCNICVTNASANGETALVTAVQYGHLEIAELLVPYSTHLDHLYGGRTLLHFSVSLSHSTPPCPGMLRMLLQMGANPEIVDSYGETPLRLAVVWKSPESINALLDAGANIDSVNSAGNTALHVAVNHAEVDICRLLLERRANRNIQNESGETPRDLAKKWNNTEILKFL